MPYGELRYSVQRKLLMKQKSRSKWIFGGMLILYLISGLLITFLLYKSWDDKEKSHFSEYQSLLDTGFLSSVQMYRLAMESFFYNSLNTIDVQKILDKSMGVSLDEEARLRGHLYRMLYPVYERMRNARLMQLQFYTPEGYSFLRFHEPERYGDFLINARPVIQKSIGERRIVQGFEGGRLRAAFSYAFPLFYQGIYVGGVEVAVSARSIIESLKELDPAREYSFVLQKDRAELHLFKEQRWIYTESHIHPKYLEMDINAILPESPKPLSANVNTLNDFLRSDPSVQRRMDQKKAFALNQKAGDIYYTVCFLPVSDINGLFTGYLISYSRDSFSRENVTEHVLWFIGLMILLKAFFFLLLKLHVQSRALMREEESLRTINNTLAEGVYVQDVKGKILRVNTSALRMLGYTKEELIGQSSHDLFHYHEKNQQSQDDCHIHQAIVRGGGYDGEEIFLTRDGQFLQMKVSSRAIFQDGKAAGAVVAFHDVSHRKKMEEQLRESEEIQRTLMASMPMAMVIIDEETKLIEHVNPAAETILNTSADRIVGHVCHKFICPAEINHCPISDLGQVVDSSDRVVLRSGNAQTG